VWDSRFLGDKPLRELKHGDAMENRSQGQRYGVAAMDWAGRDDGYTSAPVLVTGGDDGGFRIYTTSLAYVLTDS